MTGIIAHPQIPWAELPIFLALAQEKTLSGAARRLDIDRTTVGRRIEALESNLKRPLFDRVDGKFQLNLLGRKAFAAAERAEQELEVFGDTSETGAHALGKVRLSMAPHLSLQLVEPLTRFQIENPDILLELTGTDQLVSLLRYETDVALRMSVHPPRGVTKYDLGRVPFKMYRAKSVPPSSNGYITFPGGERIDSNIRKVMPDAEITMSVDGFVPLREYIAQGVGAGVLPQAFGDADPRLVAVSDIPFATDMKFWLLCLSEQRRLKRVHRLMQFLRESFQRSDADVPNG